MEHLNNIFIRDFMTKEVLTLHIHDSMAEAYDKMKDHRIRHLPVVDDQNRVIGVFTDADLNHAVKPRETEAGWYYDRDQLKLYSLSHYISVDPFTLTPDNTLKEAAQVMTRNKFGCIPIVHPDTNVLLGIITYIDVLHKITSLF